MQDDTNVFYAMNLENSQEYGLQFVIQAKSKVEVSRQISTNPKWMRKKQTVERKHTKEPLAGQFSVLSQYSMGQPYLNDNQKAQQQRMLEARISNGSTILDKNKIKENKIEEKPENTPNSPVSSAASTLKDGRPLKSVKNDAKSKLTRKSAYDNSSLDNNSPKLKLNSSFRQNNNSSPSDGSNILDARESDTLIPVARENSIGALKTTLENISSLKSNKSGKSKKNKEKRPTVDCACQTDFPWTEEDEKRERRRRKRERAEMRKQMYMLKKQNSAEPESNNVDKPKNLQKSSSNATLMNSEHNLEGNSNNRRVDSYETGDQQFLLNDSSECEMRRMLMENSGGNRDLHNYVQEDKHMDQEEVERRKRQLQKLKKASKQALQTAAKEKSQRESSSSRSKGSRSRSRSKSKVRSSLSLAKDTTPF